jgi:hypothetical protein
MNHIAQAKCIAAAQIACPDEIAKFDIPLNPALIEAAEKQGLHNNPLFVSIGKRYARAIHEERSAIQEANEHAIQGRRFQAGAAFRRWQKIYSNSFHEISANLAMYEHIAGRSSELADGAHKRAEEAREKIGLSLQGVGALCRFCAAKLMAELYERRKVQADRRTENLVKKMQDYWIRTT